METKEIVFENYRILVKRSNVRSGIYRGQLVNFAIEHPLKDNILQTIAIVLYPAAIASSEVYINGKLSQSFAPPFLGEIAESDEAGQVKQQASWERTINDFALEIPEDLLNLWIEAVYQLNPGWSPARLETERDLQEKKEEATNFKHG